MKESENVLCFKYFEFKNFRQTYIRNTIPPAKNITAIFETILRKCTRKSEAYFLEFVEKGTKHDVMLF